MRISKKDAALLDFPRNCLCAIHQTSDFNVFRQGCQLPFSRCALRLGEQCLPTCPADQAEEGVANDTNSFEVDPEQLATLDWDEFIHRCGIEIIEQIERVFLSLFMRGIEPVFDGSPDHVQANEGS
jgi:hypothetical protein